MTPPNLPPVGGEELSPFGGFRGSKKVSSFQFASNSYFAISFDTASFFVTDKPVYFDSLEKKLYKTVSLKKDFQYVQSQTFLYR